MSDDSRKRRETIMQQRLRKARGEEVDDLPEDTWDDDDEGYAPQPVFPGRLSEPLPAPRSYAASSSGCLSAGLYMVVGALAVLVIFLLLETNFNSTVGLFSRVISNVPGLSPAATPTLLNTDTIVERVQRVKRIETTSYAVQTVIEGEGGKVVSDQVPEQLQSLLWGDRILLVAHGTVVAGLDLETLQLDDVEIGADGQSVSIRLPPAQIFRSVLNNEQTQVYDREQGLLTTPSKDLETTARQFAEEKILETACQAGIMQQATSDGQQAIEQLLSMLDFKQIVVIPAEVPPCPEAPPTTPD